MPKRLTLGAYNSSFTVPQTNMSSEAPNMGSRLDRKDEADDEALVYADDY